MINKVNNTEFAVKRRYRYFLTLIFLCCATVVIEAEAQVVHLHADWSERRWQGYPDSVGKLRYEWKEKALYVDVIVNWNSSHVITNENASAIIKGDKLFLCYKQEVASKSAQHSVAPGVVAPVLLEFVVTEIPERNYAIEISSDCSM